MPRGAPSTPAPRCSPRSSKPVLEALFAVSEHVEVEATWGIYQRMIAAYREPDKKHGNAMMQAVIDSAPAAPSLSNAARR